MKFTKNGVVVNNKYLIFSFYLNRQKIFEVKFYLFIYHSDIIFKIDPGSTDANLNFKSHSIFWTAINGSGNFGESAKTITSVAISLIILFCFVMHR